MYVLIVYDIAENRVAKVCKYLRQHLTWVQNSVFEGELTVAQLEKVKIGLKKIISTDYDSVIFYIASDEKWLNKHKLGKEKNTTNSLI